MTRGGERVPGSDDRIEAEWQFDANDLTPVESWLDEYPGSADLRVMRERQVEHLDTYYDTADWRVHRAGYALRLRRRNDAAELTLKALTSQSTAFAARRELTEALAPSEDPTTEQVGGPVRQRVRALRGRTALIPLFSAITRRQLYGIWSADLRAGEVALDHTTFIGETFDDQSQLLRVEIESTDGKTALLEPFMAELQAAASLDAAVESKYETGLVRNHLAPVGPPSLAGTTFDRDASIGEVAFATLWRQLVELLRNEPGARLGDDIEALHDMRVAVRRMRAALSLFKSFLPPEILAQRDDLRWLASVLGEVRDLDVQLVAFVGWSERLDDADVANLEPLLDEVRRRRTSARERMLAALDSDRYERFITSFTELLAQPIDATNVRAALEVAPDLILRRQRSFARKAAKIKRNAPPEAVHAVRIEAKRLRYTLEFFRPLYGKGVTAYIRSLVQVQDLLGAHQDATVAVDRLRDLARESNALPGPTIFVMGRMAERSVADARALRARFPPAYKALGAKPLARLRKELRTSRRAARTPAESAPAGDVNAPNT
jgi:CHAD domain-containing protein/uncharacterized protein YjbK